MTRRHTRQVAALKKSAELMTLAPHIVAARSLRALGDAYRPPSRRGQDEMARMVSEKWQAGTESAWGIGAALMQANLRLGSQLVQQWWSMWFRLWGGMGGISLPSLSSQRSHATRTAWHMLDASLEPFQRRVRANARRLRNAP